MLSFPPSQTKTRFKRGDQVYWTNERDSKGNMVRNRYWICCVREEPDGTVSYRLKTSPNGELPGDRWITESELEEMDLA